MTRSGSKVKKGKTCITTISAPIDFIKYINIYSMNDFNGDNKRITIHLPVGLHNYYNWIPFGTRSKVLVSMVENFVKKIEVYNIGKVFISTSALVRHSILHDMTLPLKDRILTKYILIALVNNLKYKKTRKGKVGRYICLGNQHHPNGSWKKYNTEEGILRNEEFQKIYSKVGTYFSAKYVIMHLKEFKEANNMGLLNNLEYISDFKKVYEIIQNKR